MKNIVFDWSGTISDDFEIVYHTLRDIFHDLDIAPISFQHFQEVVDIPYQKYIMTLFGDDPDALAKFTNNNHNHALFEKHFRNHGLPTLLPGIQPALDQLKQRNFNMIVFSSHHKKFIDEENHAFFNGTNYFSHIVGNAGDKVDSIRQLLSTTGIDPKETLLVGDTTHDIEAGKHAGMKTAAVLTGYHIKAQLAPLQPDLILNSVSDLPEHL